ncbi:AraC family transcriptional regulator [Allostella sp. ATCC 35155]|nr:AraC family transcriptional regulator [Stella sp. ATCC 35155]
MTVGAGRTEIGIVVYPGAQLAAIHGLTDLFGIASRFSADGRSDRPATLRISHWGPGEGGIACIFRSDPTATAPPRVLILPPTLADLPDPDTCAALALWLLQRHAEGVALVTVCSGVFLLAPTGLLDGRTVSTHRSCAQALRDAFPRIAVDAERAMVEHPDILTAGGFMAWVDVALLLIERLLGTAIRTETARFALSRHEAGPPEGTLEFLHRQGHGDGAVRNAQSLVHRTDGQGLTLAAMAAAAGLERRTFLRRFVGATGMTPIEYCRAVRFARAREVLEAGNMPLKQIAEALGYGDVSSFARAFRRAHGMAPGAFRKKRGGAVAGEWTGRSSIDRTPSSWPGGWDR